ncbi:phage tail family protein [Lysinibacillus mangiferihumi]|uniref:Phage tail family protein n=1 Tax=Lysinibacillus mangiferihumi TaxID=1130819 RepID=A0A4U2ZCF2_9BACI|nr:phage tail domain-containing protein [Lysinibacillus mangiferihumi]TKI72019.1 phage tail family protein [Lysinibacillus mangiferihumi]
MIESFQSRERLIFDNHRGQTFEISVSSPFYLDKADGLEAIENEFYNVKNYNEDGTNIKGSSVRERNIVINGRIRLDKEINRQKIIRFFNPKHHFTLKYENGDVTRYIDCKVEKSPVVSRHVIPEFIISFLCPNPWWYTEEQKYEIAMWVAAFEFELEIDAEGDGIEMGYREPNNVVNVFNDSDTASPLRIQFKAIGSVVDPYIELVDTGSVIKIEATLKGGDVVTVNTKRGDEYAILERNGTQINYFNYLSHDSNLQLSVDVGDNLIRYDAAEFVSNLEVSIYFTPQFVGV